MTNIICQPVVDFRTRMEILQKPDSILEGVEYHEIPIVDEETLGITRSKGLLEMLLGFDQPIDEFNAETVHFLCTGMFFRKRV